MNFDLRKDIQQKLTQQRLWKNLYDIRTKFKTFSKIFHE